LADRQLWAMHCGDHTNVQTYVSFHSIPLIGSVDWGNTQDATAIITRSQSYDFKIYNVVPSR
jgi:hypothetical protein